MAVAAVPLFVVGVLLIIVANHRSLVAGGPSSADFGLWWLGLALLYLPAAHVAFRARPDEELTGLRIAAVIMVAVASMVPIIVRNPLHPLMFDELGHWGEAAQLATSGKLFEFDGVVPIGQSFPGLQALTVALHVVGGAPVFITGRVVLVVMHVCSLLGVTALARLAGGRRAPYLAGVLYGVSPAFIRVDGWFAYESYAVPLSIWLIVLSFYIALRRGGRGLVAFAVFDGAALVVTHHLSCYVTVLVLALASMCARLSQRWAPTPEKGAPSPPIPSARRLLASSGLLAAAGAVWAVVLGIPVVKYLAVFPKAGVQTFQKLIGQSPPEHSARVIDSATKVRGIFGGSGLPIIEPLISLLAQPALLVVALVILWRLRSRVSTVSLLGISLTGAYFASLPFTLSGLGAAGAHRSWAFSYIGIALLLGLGLGDGRGGRLTRPLAVAGVMVLLVANYAAACNAYERFPGRFVLNSDGRNVDVSLTRSATWFSDHGGRGSTILTNFRSLSVFGAYAHTRSPSDFPTWAIFYPTRAPAEFYVDKARKAGVQYVVVDSRLATDKPLALPYFDNYDPDPPSVPLPLDSITKFDRLPYLTLLHVDQTVRIYRFQ